MLPFTTKLLCIIFGLLAVATSFAAASALPGSELVARNPPKQHICQIVAVADVDVALAAVGTFCHPPMTILLWPDIMIFPAASYGKSTDVQVAAFAELVAAIDICVDAIIELKAVIDLNVVVEATVALYVVSLHSKDLSWTKIKLDHRRRQLKLCWLNSI